MNTPEQLRELKGAVAVMNNLLPCTTLEEAATELERLRAERDKWRALAGQGVQDEHGLRIELERLRADYPEPCPGCVAAGELLDKLQRAHPQGQEWVQDWRRKYYPCPGCVAAGELLSRCDPRPGLGVLKPGERHPWYADVQEWRRTYLPEDGDE